MRSLQARLLLGCGAVIALGLILTSVLVQMSARTALYDEFDSTLLDRARSVATLVEETEKRMEIEFEETDFAEFAATAVPDYFQIWYADGATLAKSLRLAEKDLSFPAGLEDEADEPQFFTVAFADEPDRRQVAFRWYPSRDIDEDDEKHLRSEDDEPVEHSEVEHGDGPSDETLREPHAEKSDIPLIVAVARGTAPVETRLSKLCWLLSTVSGLVTLACITGLWLVIRRALQPIRKMAASLAEIDERSLDRRLAIHEIPVELTPIVDCLNELLGRLETAFHREKDFSSNVAHELRTPLAGLNSTIDVYLARPHAAAEYRGALETCKDICDQCSTMVESLLALSRLERKSDGVIKQTVHVDRLLQECWEQLAERSKTKGLQAEWRVSPTQFQTDQEKLRLILRNVLTNAVSHSDDNGQVQVLTSAQNGMVNITVSNTGNKLRPDQLDRVFDRFWRGDTSRHGTGDHFGLGLTLVKSLASLLGGKIAVAVDEGLFQVKMSFPHDLPTHT